MVVMMVALYIQRPVEFSVFPTTLLLLTLFRLSLFCFALRLFVIVARGGFARRRFSIFGGFVLRGGYWCDCGGIVVIACQSSLTPRPSEAEKGTGSGPILRIASRPRRNSD